MEKEFIPYQEALDLKELGFDGKNCMRFYNPELSLENTFLHSGNIGAPLYQQAFRWFRENHSLIFCYEPCLKKDLTYIFFIYVEVTGEKVFVVESKYNEEAELACLKELIKITKNKLDL